MSGDFDQGLQAKICERQTRAFPEIGAVSTVFGMSFMVKHPDLSVGLIDLRQGELGQLVPAVGAVTGNSGNFNHAVVINWKNLPVAAVCTGVSEADNDAGIMKVGAIFSLVSAENEVKVLAYGQPFNNLAGGVDISPILEDFDEFNNVIEVDVQGEKVDICVMPHLGA